MIYNVVLVSGVQQSESVIHIHIPTLFFWGGVVFLKNIYLFIWLCWVSCCTRAFSSCSERGLLFVVVRGLLTAMASFVAEHGL